LKTFLQSLLDQNKGLDFKSKYQILIYTMFSSILSFSFPYDSILSSSIVLSIAPTFSSDDAAVSEAYAQPYTETVKRRNLTIDLGNGTTTNAELTIPAEGNGSFPGVLLIPGSGAVDMNGTGGFILIDNETGSKIYPETQIYFQLAEYLTDRGFVVLRYDKRGVGSNFTIPDNNVWGNVTFNALKQDAEKALSLLLEQPEVNATKGITLIGHSEGTTIAPRVAVDNPDKVKNVVLMAAVAHNLINDLLYFQFVETPILYAEKVLDKGHQGVLSIKEASEDPIFQDLGGVIIGRILNRTDVPDDQNKTTPLQPRGVNTSSDDVMSIQGELKPELVAAYENLTSPPASALSGKCLSDVICPLWARSHIALDSTLSMIGNISSSTSVLIMVGENDSQTPLQQALLLQQRLTEVNHPDHLIITYPDLGHVFSSSNEWITDLGPAEEYVLEDIFEWLASPAREAYEYSH
jgi:pimeloyl-ACP methyl ester carboxylesterase